MAKRKKRKYRGSRGDWPILRPKLAKFLADEGYKDWEGNLPDIGVRKKFASKYRINPAALNKQISCIKTDHRKGKDVDHMRKCAAAVGIYVPSIHGLRGVKKTEAVFSGEPVTREEFDMLLRRFNKLEKRVTELMFKDDESGFSYQGGEK